MTYSLNTLSRGGAARGRQPKTSTTLVASFAHELALIAGLLLLAFWLLAMLTYTPQDPAWSTTGAVDARVLNWGGRVGAIVADASYFLLGFSVWWCFAAAVRAWLASLARWMRGGDAVEPKRWTLGRVAFWLGFGLLLAASTTLEWTRLYRFEGHLPGGHSGGVLGYVLGPRATHWLGFTGAGLAGIVALVLGVALVFGFSWGALAERLGGLLYGVVQVRREKREAAADRAAGERAAREREETVQEERVEIDHHPLPVPLPVEPTAPPAAAPVVAAPAPAPAAAPSAAPVLRDGPPLAAAAGPIEPVLHDDFLPAFEPAPEPVQATAAPFAPTVTGTVIASPAPTTVVARAAFVEPLGPRESVPSTGVFAAPAPLSAPRLEPVAQVAPAVPLQPAPVATTVPVMPTLPAVSAAVPPAQAIPSFLGGERATPAPYVPTLTTGVEAAAEPTALLHRDSEPLPTPVPAPLAAAEPLPWEVAAAPAPLPPANPPQTVAAAAPRDPLAAARVAPKPPAVPASPAGEGGLPQIDLLDAPPARLESVSPETLEMTSRLIEKKLKDFGVQVHVVAAYPGPVVTRYEIEPATGVKGSQVVNLAKDLARSLSLVSIRVVETIPGKNYMALELPNVRRQTIRLAEILGSQVYHEARSLLTMGLGKDIVGNPVVADLAKMPHCLVAGTTGSGKSVGINAMILSLLFKADARDVRILMIDPKMLEMSVYEGIPHLLAPVVTDMKQAAHGLNWCVGEMERRYRLMSKLGVRNLAGYNTKIDDAAAREEFLYNPFSLTPDSPEPLERLPHIVVVIDELADLMMVVGKKIEELIARLAQKARAAGIHLILATQRPSVDVITGLIKANIPTRIAFQVSSKIDSRTILDQMGAEALLGMGDMLYMASGTGLPIRVHGAFVSDDEVHRVVSYLKEQGGEPNYIEGVLEGGTVDGESTDYPGADGDAGGEKDPMYDQAVEVVLKNRKASISLVQRHLKIGYNRAARLVEDMENAGLVSAMTADGKRDILVPARED